MQKLKISITGCLGRMGQQKIKIANKKKNIKKIKLKESKKTKKKKKKKIPQKK